MNEYERLDALYQRDQGIGVPYPETEGGGMNKEKALEFLKEQKEYRLFGMDEEHPSDFDKWQKNQADTYQRIIDWIEKEVAE